MVFCFFILLFFSQSFCVLSTNSTEILDPDDPNLEKTAEMKIHDPVQRKNAIKMAKFRKWLKYDVDCNFLTREELEERILKGSCPLPEEKKKKKEKPTTKKPSLLFFKRKRKKVKKEDTSLFSHQNKEKVVRAIVGNNKIREIDLNPRLDPEMEIVGGSMVTLLCDINAQRNNQNEIENMIIDWYVNNKKIETSWLDWRVSISRDGQFGIWPIEEGDSGLFECMINDELHATINIKVVPMWKALLSGLINYMIVSLIFVICTMLIGHFIGYKIEEKVVINVDQMEEFLSEHVFKTDEMAKKKMVEVMKRNRDVNENQLIEQKAEGNRSMIMMLLHKPEKVKKQKSENEASATNVNQNRSSEIEAKKSSEALSENKIQNRSSEIETKKASAVEVEELSKNIPRKSSELETKASSENMTEKKSTEIETKKSLESQAETSSKNNVQSSKEQKEKEDSKNSEESSSEKKGKNKKKTKKSKGDKKEKKQKKDKKKKEKKKKKKEKKTGKKDGKKNNKKTTGKGKKGKAVKKTKTKAKK